MVVVEIVEEMFHGFLVVLTEGTPGGACKAFLSKIIPGEDTILDCEPEEKGNLRP